MELDRQKILDLNWVRVHGGEFKARSMPYSFIVEHVRYKSGFLLSTRYHDFYRFSVWYGLQCVYSDSDAKDLFHDVLLKVSEEDREQEQKAKERFQKEYGK